MWPYLLILLLIATGMVVSALKPRRWLKTEPWLYWSIFTVMATVGALRGDLGIDTIRYAPTLGDVAGLGQIFSSGLEAGIERLRQANRFPLGMNLLASACNSILPGGRGVQIVCALWLNLMVFLFGRRLQGVCYLFLLLYLFGQYLNLNFEVMREGVAVGCFLAGWLLLNPRDGGRLGAIRWVGYGLLTIVGLSFHFSALVMLFYPLVKLRRVGWLLEWHGWWSPGLVVLCFLTGFSGPHIVGLMVSHAPAALYEAMNMKDWLWIHSMAGVMNWKGIAGMLVVKALVPLLAVWQTRRVAKGVDGDILKVAMVGVCVAAISAEWEYFGRFYNYMSLFCMASVCIWVKRNPRKWSLWVRILVVSPLIGLPCYNLFRPLRIKPETCQMKIYAPYSTWLRPVSDEERYDLYLRFEQYRQYETPD